MSISCDVLGVSLGVNPSMSWECLLQDFGSIVGSISLEVLKFLSGLSPSMSWEYH